MNMEFIKKYVCTVQLRRESFNYSSLESQSQFKQEKFSISILENIMIVVGKLYTEMLTGSIDLKNKLFTIY